MLEKTTNTVCNSLLIYISQNATHVLQQPGGLALFH